MTDSNPLLARMIQELRRGSLSLAVLLALREPRHGYALRQFLGAQGLEVDEGTLYPLVRRLEKDALLESDWVDDGGRKRRVYRRSGTADALIPQLLNAWQQLGQVIQQLAPEMENPHAMD